MDLAEWVALYRDGPDETPLHVAARRGDCMRLHEVLTSEGGTAVESRDSYGRTALHMAATGDVARALITAGANLHSTDADGATPLYRSCWEGHGDVASVLLEFGADATRPNKDQTTPLHWACRRGILSVARRLIEMGCSVHSPNVYGVTALHLCAKFGVLASVDFLLDHGADPNTVDQHHAETPLHLSGKNGHETVMKLLLARGADRRVRNQQGHTAEDLFAEWLRRMPS